ncbi:hypothetical protein CU254_12120 [Amycolatopsis sp. AA4]|uniref:hypothetical protein n=1 Tax=Actinomycetes TaxID=1760 RepID=UPI0001B55560|nr:MULTISPECIES: hypothetical protein [Actinomycetes]ATY11129.1 hypothetical protein CU254_12120 [Amycolatopsis sp. AA4]
MTSESDDLKRVVYAIYSGLFAGLTGQGDNSAVAPPFDEKETMLTMCMPGQAVLASDFANAWTPGDPKGSTENAKRMALFFNDIPRRSHRFAPNGRQLDDVYGSVVEGVQVHAPEPDPKQKEAYQKAYSFLHQEVDITDPFSGKVTKKTVPSAAYSTYLQNSTAYDQAKVSYNHAYLAAKKSGNLDNWPVEGAALYQQVQRAYDQMMADGAQEVIDAIARMSTTVNDAVTVTFADAQRRYRNAGYALDGAAAEKLYRLVYALPGTWLSTTDPTGWAKVTYDRKHFDQVDQSEADDWSAQAGVEQGIWAWFSGANGGASAEHDRKTSSTKTSSMEISFEFMSVSLYRTWMQFLVLGLPSWSNNEYPPGGISGGPGGATKDEHWPLLTKNFIAVRNVTIKADWSEDDKSIIREADSQDLNVGWGPFTVSGKHAHSTEETKISHDFDGQSLTIPGIQILGYVCPIVPYSPPNLRAPQGAIPGQEREEAVPFAFAALNP